MHRKDLQVPSSMFVDECEHLTRKEFEATYLSARRPVILRKAMKEMPAVGKWSIEFFGEHYGEHQVPIDGRRSGRTMRLEDYVNTLHHSSVHNAALYMRNFLVFEHFPELKKDFEMPWITRPNWLESRALGDFSGGAWRCWVELFLSGKGSKFPFVHIDPYYTHAWSIQLTGRKHFYLWAPIPNQHNDLLQHRIERIAPSHIGPTTHLPSLLSNRQCFELVLCEGDLAFIPAGWWHTTSTNENSVTLGGNFVEASNWLEFKSLYQQRNPPHSLRQTIARTTTSIIAPRLLPFRHALHNSFY